MEELSRVSLYNYILERDIPEQNISEQLSLTMKVNIRVLNGVEVYFLTSERENTTIGSNYEELPLLERIRSNISQLNTFDLDVRRRRALEALGKNLSQVYSDYENEYEQNKNEKDLRKLFNHIIKALCNFDNKIMEEPGFVIEQKEREDRPQVFLSHAYQDKTYTLALFEYFYKKGIYLYIDWMHNGVLKDGRILKDELKREINQSSQLLFMRTTNSELNIQGKHYIRPWCSWELGNFYNSKNFDEKYLLNLYSIDNYSNVQLHGMKVCTELSGKKLKGFEIEPDFRVF